jgi:hypothetical protein
MSRTLLIEEFHVGLFVPRQLPAKDGAAIRRTLRSSSFALKLREALLETVGRFASLDTITVKISR